LKLNGFALEKAKAWPTAATRMDRMTSFFRIVALAACIAWPASAVAQNQPTPSRDDAERNAFQTPTTADGTKPGEPGYHRDTNPLSGSQGPATNQEGKNSTEPTNRPTKATPSSPDK
jgi:hypothetical protein